MTSATPLFIATSNRSSLRKWLAQETSDNAPFYSLTAVFFGAAAALAVWLVYGALAKRSRAGIVQ